MWTVPVIAAAAAAPAYAASNFAPTVIAWSALGAPQGFHVDNGTSYNFDGVTVSYALSGTTNAPNNSTIWTNSQTGGSSSALRLYNANSRGSAQTIDLTFDKDVKNVRFSLLDIDRDTWEDQVVVTTAGFIGAKGTGVQGDGSTGSPYKPTGAGDNIVADSSAAGNVALSWAGPLRRVSFTYQQWDARVSGSPHIGIGNISFTRTSC